MTEPETRQPVPDPDLATRALIDRIHSVDASHDAPGRRSGSHVLTFGLSVAVVAFVTGSLTHPLVLAMVAGFIATRTWAAWRRRAYEAEHDRIFADHDAIRRLRSGPEDTDRDRQPPTKVE